MDMLGNSQRSELSRLSVTVYGRVQGVFFRSFVQNVARRLGVKGYVRNLVSGDAVEVQAEGPKQELRRLLEQVEAGPPGARVERMEVKWSDYSGQFDDFSIRY
ncbi:MAG: acylphosphatase [Dehalococcoidia bacterium]